MMGLLLSLAFTLPSRLPISTLTHKSQGLQVLTACQLFLHNGFFPPQSFPRVDYIPCSVVERACSRGPAAETHVGK